MIQDNALSQSTAATVEEIHNNQIFPIKWPACSPDLNSTESVWNILNRFIQVNYPDLDQEK